MLLLADITAEVMFAAGILLMIVVLFRRFKKRYRRRNQNSPMRQVKEVRAALDKHVPKADRPLNDAPPDLLRWQVEMHETARELKAELDSKLLAIQAATALATRETERLHQAISNAQRSNVSVTSRSSEPLDEIVSQLRSELSDATRPKTAQATRTTELFSAADRATVYAFADQGMTPLQISKRSKLPLGDVELILGSRPHRNV